MSVETADGQARFQMVLPMNLLLFDVAVAIEQTASQAGLLRMKALIDEEVEQLAGQRYPRQPDRKAQRGAMTEGRRVRRTQSGATTTPCSFDGRA